MKTFFTVLLLASVLFSKSQSFEISHNSTRMDTINMTDANGKKQGKWLLSCLRKRPCKCGNTQQVLEKGMYKDNKRIGEWTEYHCNGNLKSKINYSSGRPGGLITFYYNNGNIREEGTWSNNRWVGKYKSISENGDVTEITFDDKGKELDKKITPAKKTVPSNKK